MEKHNEFERVHIVAYGLSVLIDSAIHKLQAIIVFGNAFPQRVKMKTNDDWYAMSGSKKR